MGSKSPPSPPPAPDPKETAAAQAAANKESAIASANIGMINQYTPGGTLEYTQRGTAEDGTPQYSATQTLSPEQQAIYDQQTQAAQKYGETANAQLTSVSDLLSQPLDYSSLGQAPVLNEDTRSTVANSLYERFNPQFDRDRQLLETSLANQGFMQGTEAYTQAMDELNRQKNDMRLAVENAALGQASQLYGLEANQRDRGINEMIQQRTQPLNELAAMLTGTQVQGPQFVNTPQVGVNPADIMGATYGSYQGQLNAANAAAQQKAAQQQGLYNLLGTGAQAAAFAWSDRRLKTDICKIGNLPSGLSVYLYRYVWGDLGIGVMAQEAVKMFPDAVKEFNGYLAVNYARIA